MARGGWTYIITNRPHSVLYTGVTSDLVSRMEQHRTGRGSSFARRYNCTRLALAGEHATIEEAIAREKAIKTWKIERIEAVNPAWNDLLESGSALH